MPLWRIFSHPDTFSTAQKKALVESITPFYTRSGLPAFYVNVVFIPVEPSSFYIGSQPVRDMVRIAIEHIAIHRPKLDGVGNNARARMCVEIDEVVIFVHANFLADRKDEWLLNSSPHTVAGATYRGERRPKLGIPHSGNAQGFMEDTRSHAPTIS